MRGVKWFTGAALLSVALVACGAGAEITSETPADGASQATSAEPKRDSLNPKWGQTVKFDNGSTLTCGKPVAFKRDDSSFGGEKKKVLLKVKCTYVNNADETFDPAGTTGSMSADGAEGESVYATGLDAPENPVRPGKKVTWSMGYGVDSKKDVQLTVSLGFLDGIEDVTFSD